MRIATARSRVAVAVAVIFVAAASFPSPLVAERPFFPIPPPSQLRQLLRDPHHKR
jgi:hypothetical protein